MPDEPLPTEVITLLFTGIEGSNTLGKRDSESMRPAPAHHDALLRAVVIDHCDHVIKTIGDGLHAVFRRAASSLSRPRLGTGHLVYAARAIGHCRAPVDAGTIRPHLDTTKPSSTALRPLILVALAALALLGLAACRTEPQGPGPGFDPQTVALGEAVYQANCAACHGVNLEGEADWKMQNEDGSFRAPPHTAEGHTWHHPDAQLIEAIKQGGRRFERLNIGGTSNMPAYEDILTDEEIAAVLVFLKSRWPAEIQAAQQQSN